MRLKQYGKEAAASIRLKRPRIPAATGHGRVVWYTAIAAVILSSVGIIAMPGPEDLLGLGDAGHPTWLTIQTARQPACCEVGASRRNQGVIGQNNRREPEKVADVDYKTPDPNKNDLKVSIGVRIAWRAASAPAHVRSSAGSGVSCTGEITSTQRRIKMSTRDESKVPAESSPEAEPQDPESSVTPPDVTANASPKTGDPPNTKSGGGLDIRVTPTPDVTANASPPTGDPPDTKSDGGLDISGEG